MEQAVKIESHATLWVLVLIYSIASALHFAHNGLFLSAYPNLPAWLTATSVYLTWCGEFALGVIGCLIFRAKSRALGLVLIGLFAVLGFAGLDHYVVAPVSAHTAMMNASILFEAIAAAALLVYVVFCLIRMRAVTARKSM